MNSNIKQIKPAIFFVISMCISTKEHQYELEPEFDIFIFILRYSFLLDEVTKPQNSCGPKTSQFPLPQGNGEMGTRYLDPKYSRWISVDPALGKYVPGAGKANARDAGGLPGMGGLFNTVNLSLFHYAGNNPVRYVDPDGRIIQVEGDDKQIYIWDNERNDFYNKNTKKYGTNDYFVESIKDSILYLKNGSPYAVIIIMGISKNKRSASISRGSTTRYYRYGFFKENIAIKFNPVLGLELNDETDSYGSPAMSLFHEFSHAYSHLVEKKLSKRIRDTSIDKKWLNAEEYNAVQMSNKAATQLGEPIRRDYISARPKHVAFITKFLNKQ